MPLRTAGYSEPCWRSDMLDLVDRTVAVSNLGGIEIQWLGSMCDSVFVKALFARKRRPVSRTVDGKARVMAFMMPRCDLLVDGVGFRSSGKVS